MEREHGNNQSTQPPNYTSKELQWSRHTLLIPRLNFGGASSISLAYESIYLFFSIFTPLGWVLLWPRFSFLSSWYYRCVLPCPTHIVLNFRCSWSPGVLHRSVLRLSHISLLDNFCPNFLTDCSFFPTLCFCWFYHPTASFLGYCPTLPT